MDRGLLIGTWGDGVWVVRAGEPAVRELAGRSVRGLASDGAGRILAVVGGRSLRRRSAAGAWSTLADGDAPLACAVSAAGVTYVGTDDARVLRLDSHGALQPCAGFEAAPGRASWYAGQAQVDGRWVGPPLGVRSMAATADGGALLANVHVGGIPRSTDGGATWAATIEIDSDVHEVRAHPTRPGLVAAATARGLALSRDAGATWTLERSGLHASYCSAVAFCGDDVWVAASEHHFATWGALYRRPIEGPAGLAPLGGGLPARFAGIVDTGCIATAGAAAAVVDKGGHLWRSGDGGRSWSSGVAGLLGASCASFA